MELYIYDRSVSVFLNCERNECVVLLTPCHENVVNHLKIKFTLNKVSNWQIVAHL